MQISHAEAQELHQLIGRALWHLDEGDDPYEDAASASILLRRARELAGLVVADTLPKEERG